MSGPEARRTRNELGLEPAQLEGGRGARVFGGTRWLSGSQVLVQLLRIGVYLVLARLLDPSAFGLLAMALVVTNFLDVFRDLGTRSAIIQRRDVPGPFASSMFFFNAGLGALLTVAVVAVAPAVAAAYGDPDVAPVLQVMGLAIVIASVGLVQQGLLYRTMAYRRVAAVQIGSALAQAVTSLTLAVLGFGVWALVAGVVANAAGTTLAAWAGSPWRPNLHFRWADVRSVWGFSLNLSASQLFSFLVGNFDKAILGRALGAAPLGVYTLAQRIVLYPIRSMVQVLQEVLFPALSRIQDDDEAIGRGYLRACAGIALVTFPMTVGLAVVAGPFVEVVLGPGWGQAAPIIAVLGPIGALQSLNYTVSILYQVKGRTDWLLRWGVGSGLLILLAYVVALPWGILGVVYAYAGMILVLTYPAFAIPFRLIGLPFRRLARTLWPTTVGTAVMAAGVLGWRYALEARDVTPLGVLASSVAVGVALYALFVWRVRPPAFDDLLHIVFRRDARPRDGAGAAVAGPVDAPAEGS